MGTGEACAGVWWGNLEKGGHWRDLRIDGRIVIKWIFRKWDVGLWTGSTCLRRGTVGGHL